MEKRVKLPFKFRAVVVVPVLEHLNLCDWKHFRPSLEQALAELSTLSIRDLHLPDYNPEELQVIVRKTPDGKGWPKDAKPDPRFPGHPRFPCRELEWSVNLTLTKCDVTTFDGKPVPLDDGIFWCTQVACEEFASRVVAILGFKQLSDNLGRSEIERALNAFSYLLDKKSGHESDLVDLTWAMIGLEALYGRGTSDLTYQLVEKTGVLLGQSSGFEKSVREMYRFRSLFIHGKAPFPGARFESDGLPEYERHSDDASDASLLAIAMLLSSLQQLAKRNWTSLNFSFIVEEDRES